jgi:hypothetical protein
VGRHAWMIELLGDGKNVDQTAVKEQPPVSTQEHA